MKRIALVIIIVGILIAIEAFILIGAIKKAPCKNDDAERLDREVVISYTYAHNVSCKVVKDDFKSFGDGTTEYVNGRRVSKFMIYEDWECSDGRTFKTKE